jgi:hypothetical protein
MCWTGGWLLENHLQIQSITPKCNKEAHTISCQCVEHFDGKSSRPIEATLQNINERRKYIGLKADRFSSIISTSSQQEHNGIENNILSCAKMQSA